MSERDRGRVIRQLSDGIIALCRQADADGKALFDQTQIEDFLLVALALSGVRDPTDLPGALHIKLKSIGQEVERSGAREEEEITAAISKALEIPLPLISGLIQLLREVCPADYSASAEAAALLGNPVPVKKETAVPVTERLSPLFVASRNFTVRR